MEYWIDIAEEDSPSFMTHLKVIAIMINWKYVEICNKEITLNR
jgi:hypothetical protein